MGGKKKDYLQECMESSNFQGTAEEFKDLYCRVCQNQECVHSGWGDSRWLSRMVRQEEALHNPIIIDPSSDPLYFQISQQDFITIDQKQARIFGGWADIDAAGRVIHWAEPETSTAPGQGLQESREALKGLNNGENPQGDEDSDPPGGLTQGDDGGAASSKDLRENSSGEFQTMMSSPPKNFQHVPDQSGTTIDPGQGVKPKSPSSFLLGRPDPWAIQESGQGTGGGTGKLTVRVSDGKVVKKD